MERERAAKVYFYEQRMNNPCHCVVHSGTKPGSESTRPLRRSPYCCAGHRRSSFAEAERAPLGPDKPGAVPTPCARVGEVPGPLYGPAQVKPAPLLHVTVAYTGGGVGSRGSSGDPLRRASPSASSGSARERWQACVGHSSALPCWRSAALRSLRGRPRKRMHRKGGPAVPRPLPARGRRRSNRNPGPTRCAHRSASSREAGTHGEPARASRAAERSRAPVLRAGQNRSGSAGG
jgi:hypothetical protein